MYKSLRSKPIFELNLRAVGVGALRSGWGSLEIDLVVHIIASVGDDRWRWVKRATLVRGVGGQVVGANGGGWASEDRLETEEGGEGVDSPGGSSRSLLEVIGKNKGSDRVETGVDVAEDGVNIEVGCAKLGNEHPDRVQGVDVDNGLRKSIDGAVLGVATVPVLGPLLWHILVVPSLSVELGADDGAD